METLKIKAIANIYDIFHRNSLQSHLHSGLCDIVLFDGLTKCITIIDIDFLNEAVDTNEVIYRPNSIYDKYYEYFDIWVAYSLEDLTKRLTLFHTVYKKQIGFSLYSSSYPYRQSSVYVFIYSAYLFDSDSFFYVHVMYKRTGTVINKALPVDLFDIIY